MNIYVANLNFDVQDEDLKEFFVSFCQVSSAQIITDRTTGRSRGFGFVEMTDELAGKKAIAELDGTTMQGRTIKVNEAKPKQEKSFADREDKNYNHSKSYNQTRY